MQAIDELKFQLDLLAEDFIAKHKDLGMEASGDWVGSVEVVMDIVGGKVLANDYTEYLVQGRGPNENQDDKAIMRWAVGYGTKGGAIYEWAKAKGFSGDNFVGMAYNIAKNGTSYYPEGTDLVDGVNTEQRQLEIFEKVGIALQAQITDSLVRAIKTVAV